MEFPYLKKTTDLGWLYTPYCWIDVLTNFGKWRKIKFLFDTGADFTTLPKFMASVVGTDILKAKQEIMYTANKDQMVTYLGKLNIRLDGQETDLSCVFTERDDTPFLLGRAGIINRFEMHLSARQKMLFIHE